MAEQEVKRLVVESHGGVSCGCTLAGKRKLLHVTTALLTTALRMVPYVMHAGYKGERLWVMPAEQAL
jgi:hypothetical protein